MGIICISLNNRDLSPPLVLQMTDLSEGTVFSIILLDWQFSQLGLFFNLKKTPDVKSRRADKMYYRRATKVSGASHNRSNEWLFIYGTIDKWRCWSREIF